MINFILGIFTAVLLFFLVVIGGNIYFDLTEKPPCSTGSNFDRYMCKVAGW